ncbi:enoyl-CoA hydratase-related protein [Pseudokordiimonas caeni]|uniref:enoyl-CoA hydratase-related protein n=1 Tax=Pseudokordiimonas caeni TaxID=2997908 RepID=UPI0028111117|nr:enoyl-CoA hydratase-related protein [Pseudokordiimonas caeni]
MSDKYEAITLTIEDGLAVLTLNQPDRLNALSKAIKSEVTHALRTLGRPGGRARALLITGSGRGFCSGANLAEGMGGDADSGANLMDTYHPMLLELAALPIPVISAVNGVAAGAGMSLALSADIVLASRSAYFLLAFVNIGLVPDAGVTFLLPRLIGKARATAQMMLGEKISAETAKDWGMIYDVVEDDDLMPTALALGKRLANGPTKALSGIRQLMAASLNGTYVEQLQREAETQRQCSRTADFIEGVSAFMQKRPTKFEGR